MIKYHGNPFARWFFPGFCPFGCAIYLVSSGFLWPAGGYTSPETRYALMMYLFGHGLSLLINHETSIWLRNLLGFFWFPMANRWLHFIRNSVCPYDVPVWPWPIPAHKSRDVHLVAQFTWFLLVSYGHPVVTLTNTLS